MLANLILGSVALIGTVCTGGLLVIIIGIRRGDRCKRLTGRPGSTSEMFARQLLSGSRGYNSPCEAGEGDAE
jgi:hypothetical protein